MAVSITPLSKNIGAEVTGVDFSQPLTAADLADIKQALLDHLVMVVRDQSLDPKQLLAATRLFGETMEQHLTDTLMDGHPEIAVLDSSKMPSDKQGRVIPFGARTWHTDHTNHEHPPKYTALYAINLPASGGDTSFANMNFGYTALPREEQASLLDLQTVNKIEDFGYIGEEARVKFGTLPVHPLIRTHPETGKKALYVHPGKLERIVGRDPNESQTFINNLLDRVITPENTYRHKWRLGDLLFCDNRAVLHRAHKDYDMAEGRVMHRVILRGDRPA
ncbi:MAG: TauD/TfdA family dioxygenase, partial [Pseudomonadota bacterium]|nr:TauD/TfdA family dioxygenase [Pseudomonadota bacterium]